MKEKQILITAERLKEISLMLQSITQELETAINKPKDSNVNVRAKRVAHHLNLLNRKGNH